ncbi:hypothetical protein C8034_v009174 [Colletotrichum sidae]|uniref:Uncharacterized protein n=4 Tax=Colletotrichum orbiculare species complex TaxID=2707354 RepID=N4VID8_COLOR|nr:hypothetical protein Cob_v006064 [Colletotrichum orbiculare MAFF 240422]TDZ34165.1 hypothetical protein C8035_v009548 [Colletotrichum spinosum]TDZ44818.1 hypothetical protein CTRI78_v009322 [Colletotrichum trifolii]TEA20176.1 hypothetical protein C8034_v009174 [Colletotrichum sidae]
MKATVLAAAALAQGAAAVANPPGNWGPGGNGAGWGGFGGYGGGWGGFGPGGWGNGAACASSCFSSHWATATPTPQAFCTDAPALKDCVNSACATETAALSSYSSVSSSVCSAFSSCTSTGTFTYSGGWWGGASKTDAAVTVTGCPVDGWWGPGGAWGGMGPGWAYKTDTLTVTRTVTSNGNVIVTTGPATVAQAVSGSSTLLTTFTGAFAAQETGTTSGSGAQNAAAGVNANVKIAGACLGAAVAVVGLM